MKIIYPNNVATTSADEENTNFPATNLTDKHPKKVWKGTSNTATVSVVIDSDGADTIAFYNCNADSVVVTSRFGAKNYWATGNAWIANNVWYVSTSSAIGTYTLDPEDRKSVV